MPPTQLRDEQIDDVNNIIVEGTDYTGCSL